MNSVQIVGNLTRDVELRETTTGKKVAKLSLAVQDRFNREQAHYFDVTVWGAAAENAARYLSKGKKAGVIGRLQTRSYEAKDGSKRKITEIVASEVHFLSPASSGSDAGRDKRQEDDWSDVGREVEEDLTGKDDEPF